MQDATVPLNRLITYALWALAGLTLAAAWLVAMVVDRPVGLMLGITAVCFCAMAGVSQIRCYVVRICGLLRAYERAERERARDLHTVH